MSDRKGRGGRRQAMELEGLSRCETIAASGTYHLRRLTARGQLPSGGCDSPTMCGLRAAWDVPGGVTHEWLESRPHYGRPCRRCVEALELTGAPREGDERQAYDEKGTAEHMIPRAGTADEVAQAIMLVVTNDFMTGTTIDVDGGWLLS